MKGMGRIVGVVLLAAGSSVCSGAIKPVTDLDKALASGKEEGKMVFILYGREQCGNCQALRSMIQAGQVHLRENEIVYADVNCDDRKTSQKFYSTFKVEGHMLPFVVITDPSGHQLAARTGYGSADKYADLIQDARKQYTPKRAGAVASVAGVRTPAMIAASDGREMRVWKFKNRTTNEAALYSQAGSFVVLRKPNGAKLPVNVSSLSAGDLYYLEQLRAGPAAAE